MKTTLHVEYFIEQTNIQNPFVLFLLLDDNVEKK